MVRGLIGTMTEEVEEQPGALERFSAREFPTARKGSIFVGAGDSYAAALAGLYASQGRSRALDPYVLASAPEFADGADVYFISVSGRTTSNILAAKRAKGHARRTAALTAVPDSPLARTTDGVVMLPLPYRPRTPGMLSFSLSLVAVLKIAGVDDRCDFARTLREARGDRLSLADKGVTYFLGNSLAHASALYAAAKVYEILGAKAQAELLEEFSHLELFSLGKSDMVNVFACFDPSGRARMLDAALVDRGYRSELVRGWGRSATELIFHSVFLTQLSVLAEARNRRLTEPRFLSARGALNASDEMIY